MMTMDRVDFDTISCWIEENFKRLSCVSFIPGKDNQTCGCGRLLIEHSKQAANLQRSANNNSQRQQWNFKEHTRSLPTNAFGVIEFEGTSHPSRAHYIRLSYDTKPALVLKLLTQVWNLSLPKLVISVLGDSQDFQIDSKLKECLSNGLFKAVHTTGGWIITNGMNTGASEHIGEAFSSRSPKVKSNTVIIGIAPWGMIEGRQNLIGRNVTVPYNPIIRRHLDRRTLNSNHSYFLLVDNGTQGSYVSTYLFRKLLERYIAKQVLTFKGSSNTVCRRIPLISMSIAGTINLIKDVIECITSSPPVPVVICDGSGSVSDLISFYIKNAHRKPAESFSSIMRRAIMRAFPITETEAQRVLKELQFCYARRKHIAIFEYWKSDERGLDHCILNCLLETHYGNYTSRLSMALSWNHVDLARDFIFNLRQGLSEGCLDEGMTEALITNKVEFVKLFLENGLSMQKFLTLKKLEELYNSNIGIDNLLGFMIKDVRKTFRAGVDRILLYDIGLVVEKLLGFGFRCSYTRRTLRESFKNNKGKMESTCTFSYPYNELLIWAVLTKRHSMALFVWERGEQALAKALIAMKLNKSLAREAESNDMASELADEFLNYSKEYGQLALGILGQCYKEDAKATIQLLTCEMKNLSDWTCLFLSALCNHKEFIAHQSCQNLLNDLWMGGMLERTCLFRKVLAGVIFFPLLFTIEFKTCDELQQMPQTEAEHLQEMYTSESSDSEDSSDDSDDHASRRRKNSHRREISPIPLNNENCIQNAYSNGSIPDISVDEKIVRLNNRETVIQFHPSNTPSMTSMRSKRRGIRFHLSKLRNSVVGERKRRHGELKVRKKIYEFYNAPVTKFCENFLLYVIFLIAYIYMVLVETPPTPSFVEIFVWVYVLSLSVEMVMDFMCSPIRQHGRRFRSFFSDFSTLCATGAILMFYVAVGLRIAGLNVPARVIYCTNVMYWILNTFSFLIVEKHIGPIVHIAARNIIDLLQFVVILVISMMAFGVNRQSIKFPNENFSWHLVKNVFLEPYFMLYGEVYAPDIDPPCDSTNGPGCRAGHWITPLTMCIYMIICNVLLLSMLIARLNSTFARISSNSSLYWKFQRYHYVMRYEAKPILPAPFVIFSFLHFICRYLYKRIRDEPKPLNKGLKVFLDDKEMEALHDFEEQCVEEYFYISNRTENEKFESKAMVACDRVGSLCLQTNQLFQSNYAVRYSIQLLESKIVQLEEQNRRLVECVQNYLGSSQTYYSSNGPDRSKPTGIFNYTNQKYEPNSIAQLVSMLMPTEDWIEDLPEAPEQAQPFQAGDHQIHGQFMERVLRRRARHLSQVGDSSMLILDAPTDLNDDVEFAESVEPVIHNNEGVNSESKDFFDVKMIKELGDPEE